MPGHCLQFLLVLDVFWFCKVKCMLNYIFLSYDLLGYCRPFCFFSLLAAYQCFSPCMHQGLLLWLLLMEIWTFSVHCCIADIDGPSTTSPANVSAKILPPLVTAILAKSSIKRCVLQYHCIVNVYWIFFFWGILKCVFTVFMSWHFSCMSANKCVNVQKQFVTIQILLMGF